MTTITEEVRAAQELMAARDAAWQTLANAQRVSTEATRDLRVAEQEYRRADTQYCDALRAAGISQEQLREMSIA